MSRLDLKFKFQKRVKNIFANSLILLLACFITFVFAEISVRLYQQFFYPIPFLKSRRLIYDKELGWKGKMVFGNPRSEKLKILIIGDSYTHGLGVKRKEMYYTTLKRELNAEIFAYSAIGYGTLQEGMVLDRYLEDIRPDLILL